MPKRKDIKKILIVGSGPIVIGQACEFDYSGSQACKALKEEGYQTVLVNSNPATIQTDPEMADKVYIEPLTPEFVKKIIIKERPQAILSTMGGQTALNICAELYERGILKKYNVELIGAKFSAIKKAEDRILFKKTMKKIGLKVPESKEVYSLKTAKKVAKNIGYPVVIRPAYTLGGTGGGIASNERELENLVERGLKESRISQVLIEKSVLGWKEYELEVMRDLKDNVVIVCSIENFDPMGIHTGDSITVAPAQTLTDREYQRMRDWAIKIIREIGVEAGGMNIQFAVNPKNGEQVVIEINPRVSRSSALASKATGFPIAKIAAKLAVGLTLDEIPNDITKSTFSAFEPTLDYVVLKIPRWAFEKFPKTERLLSTQMKSVGEVMAIGRTFEEALQKAIRGLDIKKSGLETKEEEKYPLKIIKKFLSLPHFKRIFFIKAGLKKGLSTKEIHELTKIDPWFIEKIKNIVKIENEIEKFKLENIPPNLLLKAKKFGFSDKQIGKILNESEQKVREKREKLRIKPVFKLVDTCGAEFEAKTPYFYSTYEREDEVKVKRKRKVVILGSGPNRIGQGIEFDYCCVQAVFASKEEGFETIMINCNPETVSTDYEIADKLYFEPLTTEDVLNVIEKEKPKGVILQLGGQTPINICFDLAQKGVKILGTQPWAIDIGEDREKFYKFAERLKILIPKYGIAKNLREGLKIAKRIGYPVLIRPSYVLGGLKMEIVNKEKDLKEKLKKAFGVWEKAKPILIDKFLENAKETEIDAIFDGKDLLICGIMEHVQEAGIHSGDACCVFPPFSLKRGEIEKMVQYTKKIAKSLKIRGVFNIQFAVKEGKVFVLEINPRASRTLPYLSKATGFPLAKIATKVILGKKLRDMGLKEKILKISGFAVKEVVLPFDKLEEDIILGPQMKSTGEVMGRAEKLEPAFFKAQIAAGKNLPLKGNVLLSIKKELSPLELAKKFYSEGFKIFATRGTAKRISKIKIPVRILYKIQEKKKPNVLDYIKQRKIDLAVVVPSEKTKIQEYKWRRALISFKIPYFSNLSHALMAIKAISWKKRENKLEICPLKKRYNF